MSKSTKTKEEKIQESAREFIRSTKEKIPNYSPGDVINIDQSGFQREMHTGNL